ncbi:TRAP transporter permease [Alteribacillus bidgolensis]|uniref:TRAP transporter, 4TM/12TM fusion protein n=1 Tax=Alteribacillus bidgolensis TaxID=930129 RepID=A0A1G8QV26_9BACI|nr:TRAP transporter fused permease subunit [Alteribacillus bidgolensis]SDJ08556.1 TRAP transporter, 4TM/12TM fusion protein [Alteribacillus bidgolensis]
MSENVSVSRFRKLNGSVLYLWQSLLILIPVSGILFIFSVYRYFNLSLYSEQYAGLILGLILAAIFIGTPATKKAQRDRVPWYDWVLSVIGFIAGLYIALYYPDVLLAFTNITTERLVLGTMAVLLILEALRRIQGWTFVIVVLCFLMYAFVAPFMPGPFEGRAVSFNQLVNYLYLDTNSILELLSLAATMGLAFVMFGQVLINFKGGEIFNNIALTLFGRYRGGPAKASVIGSSMVGSITGGPVANVMLTGNMSIPLMVRNGYTRVQAGAIESVASTGGTILPPLMGIVAFIIAERLGVPYREVAVAAIVPALLYYICVYIRVDLIAAEKNLGSMIKAELPAKKDVLLKSMLIVPIFIFLVYLLFIEGRSPEVAGISSAVFALAFLLIQKETRRNIMKRIQRVLLDTGEVILEVGIVLAAAGLVVGIIGVTGLGFNLVSALAQLGQYGLFPLLLGSAVVSVILGMGLPAIAAYSIVAVLVAPTLVELGAVPMAAHLFVFFFAIVSNFTPPIAFASIAAASIAKDNPHKISFESMKFGFMAYLIPFLFVYNPVLLLSTNVDYSYFTIATSIITTLIGCYLLSISVTGYLFKPLSFIHRVIFVISVVLLFFPVQQNAGGLLNWAGLTIGAALFIQQLVVKKRNNIIKYNENQQRVSS